MSPHEAVCCNAVHACSVHRGSVHLHPQCLRGCFAAIVGVSQPAYLAEFPLFPALHSQCGQKLGAAEPDFERFRCLQLAYDVLREGGTAPAILNAANETAVAAFLAGSLPFLGIARLNEATLNALPARPEGSLEDVLAADAEARLFACQAIRENSFS